MLRAFADRENIRIRGLHEIVDDNAAAHVEPGFAPELGIGTNAERR